MDQPGDLFLDGGNHSWRTVPQNPATPTRKKVEILVPLIIPNTRIHSAFQANRIPGVVGDYILLKPGLGIRVHFLV